MVKASTKKAEAKLQGTISLITKLAEEHKPASKHRLVDTIMFVPETDKPIISKNGNPYFRTETIFLEDPNDPDELRELNESVLVFQGRIKFDDVEPDDEGRYYGNILENLETNDIYVVIGE